MKKIISSVIICLFLISFHNSKADVVFSDGSFSEIMDKAKQENKIIMIDFVTDWCKWCVETDRKVYTNADVYDFANANQINWKIDAEKGEGPDLAKRYGVKGYPTIVFTQPDGTEIDRIYGYLPAEQFLIRMKEYHAGTNTYGALKKAVEDNPDDPAANYNFADKIVSNGLEGDAKIFLSKTISVDPDNTAGFTDDAKFLLAYLNEDESALSAALREYPNSNKAKDAYMNLASFYAGKPDYKMAEDMYKEAFRNFGENDFDLRQGYGGLLMGEAYSVMKDEKSTAAQREGAIAVLQKCLPYVQGTVNEASTYFMMSDLYLQSKDYQKAEQCIDKSIVIYDKKSYRDQKAKIEKQKAGK
jgi:thioredoxin-related protein